MTRACCILLALALSACGEDVRLGNAPPGEVSLDLSATLSGLPQRVISMAELDGDSRLEVLVAEGAVLHILEDDGAGGLVSRYEVTEIGGVATALLADLHGDGKAELFHCSATGACRVHAAAGDDDWVEWGRLELGAALTGVVLGDLNRDGSEEVIGIRLSDPPAVVAIAAEGLQTYGLASEWPFEEPQNLQLIGVGDVDGDGHREISCRHVDPDRNVHQLGMLIDGALVGRSEVHDFSPISLGDLEGDGRAEIVGFRAAVPRILAVGYQGDAEGYGLVLAHPVDGFDARVRDFDDDGRVELQRLSPVGDLSLVRFELAHVVDGEIRSYVTSGDLLADDPAAISRIEPLGDFDADGRWEVAVVQGDSLRILESAEKK